MEYHIMTNSVSAHIVRDMIVLERRHTAILAELRCCREAGERVAARKSAKKYRQIKRQLKTIG